MEQVEQGLSGLTELIDRYGKEIRFISEEALDGDREPSAEEFRSRVTGAQDRIYREALETYDRIVKAGQEIEQDLINKLNQVKETMGRAAVLKEVIRVVVMGQ
jgi:hypothetical protein